MPALALCPLAGDPRILCVLRHLDHSWMLHLALLVRLARALLLRHRTQYASADTRTHGMAAEASERIAHPSCCEEFSFRSRKWLMWHSMPHSNKPMPPQHRLQRTLLKPLLLTMHPKQQGTISTLWTVPNKQSRLAQRHSDAYRMPTQRFTTYSKHSTLSNNNSQNTNNAKYIECQK